ncbi:MAG: aspartate carbamoyltransferase [Bacteroidales bacterium]|nr:aspartate carbamoyltransferase [Bacteroidales bacterium]MBP5724151.1 aspartate carbamoyltransferase [Bacteroidales bacterium]MBQ3677520.1 aspartate carbamoyltransferase [Bacteroidales bacterium]MBR4497046.1 aspartate carbamoyltransferase [Bacteroidales bacterium]MBR4690646.1 aspartate carbamoyltransferase [Bacteroidales bacterium]
MNKAKSLVSITDFDVEEYLKILELAAKFEANSYRNVLNGRVIASLFFEPSTRTRLSFESAINRLGGRVIGFSDIETTSSTKGETLHDTIKIISNYCDLIVMRHPLEGAAKFASEVANVPIINAGDGANQHPTQTLLDMYSITKTQGTLSNLSIALIGDLKYGRTVHSLIMAMKHFNPTFHLVAPPELALPNEYKTILKENNIPFYEHTDMSSVLNEVDIVYMTRVQKERFSDLMEYEKTKNTYILRNEMLAHTKANMKILHPLPRVNEIQQDVDENPKAYYFEQARNGVFTRQAIISYLLQLNV